MMLSPHFALEELTTSDYAARHGIDNSPPQAVFEALLRTSQKMETVRRVLGYPIHVSSGYRCAKLNAAIGGVPTSAHLTGDAVDFICPQFGTTFDVACAIERANIDFDQLIIEYGWVHISFAARLRRQCLTKRSAASPYQDGLIP